MIVHNNLVAFTQVFFSKGNKLYQYRGNTNYNILNTFELAL